MAEQTLATVANMRKAEELGKRAVAFSLNTMEQYSATSGDYFSHGEDEPLVDNEGTPMVLVVKVTRYLDVLSGADVLAEEYGEQ